MSSVAECPSCRGALSGALCNTPTPVACPDCDTLIQVEVFPALFKPVGSGPAAETILEEGVSSCFYHEQKKAVVPCDGCGRFLCALCDVELNGRHVCPSCLQSEKKKGSVPQLENRRVVYDAAALGLALYPILFYPVTLITAPVAVILAVFSLFKPTSLVSRSRVRSYIALALGLLEITGWVAVFVNMSHR